MLKMAVATGRALLLAAKWLDLRILWRYTLSQMAIGDMVSKIEHVNLLEGK